MQHEEKKLTLIINELLTLLLLNGAEEIDVNIKRKGDASEITMIHRQCKYDAKFIEKMKYNLNTQRQSEVEGYYWQLVGEDDSSNELHLVGAMIDTAEVDMKQNDLHIFLVRKK
ncbi:hypothetical protein acsn021_22360 [Anaerocolumna cellulosilytica]|uniref:Uncharacterized protein n=1 Tax=Anaerocolumna cellulosilytica TaxID=433286 RepID=A0A6S6R3Q3_9FIRM|nr:hypothetical protein [Anaerocolumna cellulosilytica]MBB5194118.1 hypothetical protein [Anaerocolumna cellulosilytica]BCJ94667.1 hypothetical protein acsn021_22360 [Anaerocolumna cellulosilytica]